MRTIGRIVLLSAIAALGQSNVAAATACGEVVTIETHDRTATRYALAYPQPAPPQGVRVALVLLVGGGGHPDLDEQGCPRALTGNSLVRSLPLFHGAGFATALVDAPSDHWGEDGLAGFRVAAEHAEDLGKEDAHQGIGLAGGHQPGLDLRGQCGCNPFRAIRP
jgi:hypothetical protein